MNRVIIFSYDFPPNNGGISRLCGEIRKELLRRGIEVLAITCCPGPDEDGVIRVSGRRGLLELRMRACLKKNYREGDVVLCDTWHPAATLALTVTKNVYILAHGAELLPGSGLAATRLWNAYRRKVLTKAKGVISNSHYTDRLAHKCAPKSKGVAIPLAIDAEYFHPTQPKNTGDDILRLCSLSRLLKFKGHDFVLTTIASLPEKYRRALHFDIGGKGDYKDVLERLTAKLGLDDTVTFKGFMPDSDVLDFYSSHDAFILCTREEPEAQNVEGFGLVFTEAQACGTAVVGTRTGGIPDAIHEGRGGWLVEQDNEKELRDLLIWMIEHKRAVQEAGEEARRRVIEECSWQGYADALLAEINRK